MAANIRTVELQQLLVALFETRRGEELFHVFPQEQVLDKETVSLMTDESLKAMGLKAGEIARLKVGVAKDEKKKKVVDLIEQIRLKNVKKGNARKFKGQRVTLPVAKKQHCKVNIGWLHSENGQTFKQVRLQDGGGTRILDFPSSDLVTVDSIKQRSLKVFAKGIAKFLSADSVIASVGNFNREEIDDFKTIDGETCDFTEYLKSHGLYASKIKLYLLTQPNLSLLDNRKDTSMTESDERVEQTKKVTEASSTCTLSDMPSISDIGPSTPNVSPHISASTPAMGSDMPSIPEGGPSTPAMRSDMPSILEGGPSTPAMRSNVPSIPEGGLSTPAMRSNVPSIPEGGLSTPAMRFDMPSIPEDGPSTPNISLPTSCSTPNTQTNPMLHELDEIEVKQDSVCQDDENSAVKTLAVHTEGQLPEFQYSKIDISYFMEKESSYSEVVTKFSTMSRSECHQYTSMFDPDVSECNLRDIDPIQHGFKIQAISKQGKQYLDYTYDNDEVKFTFPSANGEENTKIILHGPREIYGYDGNQLILGVVASCHGQTGTVYTWKKDGNILLQGCDQCCYAAV